MKGKLSTLLLVIVAGIFSATGLKAQEGLKLGFAAVPQNTWLLNQQDQEAALDQYDYKTTFGMAFGPTFGYDFSEYIGFRIQGLYSAQGQQWENINDAGDVVLNTQRLNYLKTPLMVNYTTGTSRAKVAFSIGMGYQASFLINARYRNDDQSYTPDEALFDNITNYPTNYQRFNWLDHGPVAQIGVDIKLTYNVVANLQLRGDYSIADVENKNAAYKEWVNGIPRDVTFYDQERGTTSNLTTGLVFGLTYTFSSY